MRAISALEGDNVVDSSKRMPWYHGPTRWSTSKLPPSEEDSLQRFSLSGQAVIRQTRLSWVAGRIASGSIIPGGDLVAALPSGRKTRVRSIVTYDGELRRLPPPCP